MLFGDGGGAAIIEYSETPRILGMTHGADGNGGKFLYRTGVRSEINGKDDEHGCFAKTAATSIAGCSRTFQRTWSAILARAGLTLDEIDWFVPHSANLQMIEALTKRIGFPMERTLVSACAITVTLLR